MGKITAPVLLTSEHDTGDFSSGNLTLDEWLVKRALKNQNSGASRTFVISNEESKVIGYYALATGSVERDLAPGNFSRGMPEPIPVIVLGRLAIDQNYQGQRIGAGLLKDAMIRTLSVTKHIGARGLLVHAISDDAKRFYERYGFQPSRFEPMTLVLSIKNIEKHLTG